jgi:hypothetical protein
MVAKLHQGELLADRELRAGKQAPQSIAPLESGTWIGM